MLKEDHAQHVGSVQRDLPYTYKVTAIVSVFRAERFMQGLLDDLERQTLARELEIVIIDAASDENERRIIEQYQKRNKNIQYVRTGTRIGIYEAWNLGVRLARGQYITNANADDRHRPDAFEKMVKILEENPAVGLVYADVGVTEQENGVIETAKLKGEFRWPDFNPQLLFQVCFVGPQPMWRHELHKRYGYFDPTLKSAGDYEFWLRICRKETFVHIPEILGLYLLSSSGVEHGNQSLSCRESELVRKRYWPMDWGNRPTPKGSYFVSTSDVTVSKDTATAGPLVSIIMPTYNRSQMLLLALESIVSQTYSNWEVIVVNDGGDDVENVLATVFAGERIVYVRLPQNHERSHARNTGIRLAKGKYIAYLDDDDQFLPDHLETLVAGLETSNYEVAYTDAYRVTQEKISGRYVEIKRDVPYSYEFSRDNLLQQNFIPILCVMHRRSCLDRTGLFDENLNTHEDWDLWIRMSEETPFHHINKVTAEFSWRLDGSTTTSSRQDDFIATKARIFQRYGNPIPQGDELDKKQYQLNSDVRKSKGAQFSCSIIIPVFNQIELTKQCLTHLAEVTTQTSYEVIVVDNNSSDGTAEFLSSLSGDIQIINNPENYGFAKACNQGAAAARGKYIVFLNNDTIPKPGWLKSLVSEVDSHEDVAVVGSKLLYPNNTIQHAGVAFSRYSQLPYHIFNGFPENRPEVNSRKEFQSVTAACMLVRKEVFEKIGGFDEGFVNGFEDVDLCLKIRQMGKKVVYQPKSCLYHLESQSPGRKKHDKFNAERLANRWKLQWLVDEDIIADQSGLFIQYYLVDEQQKDRMIPKNDVDHPRSWQQVVELQQLLIGQKRLPLAEMANKENVRKLLDDINGWPPEISVLVWLGGICEVLDCEQKAIQCWEKLLTVGDSTTARIRLARGEMKNGNFDEAQKHLDVLKLGFFPGASEASGAEYWVLQGILSMQRQNYPEAKDAFDQALDCDAGNRKARIGLGMACMGLNQNAETWNVCEQVILEYPDNVETIHCLIQAGTALQSWEALGNHLARYVERNPADCEMRFVLAGVEFRADHLEKAKEQLTWLKLIKPEYEGLEDLERLLQSAQPQGNCVPTR